MTPHLKVKNGQISPYVIVCGDPGRALEIAKLADSYEEIANNREYRSFNVVHRGQSLTVTSHGVGAAGAAICFNELIQAGAKVIVRVGTCGVLCEGYDQGDLIVATGAVREDGVTPLMVPVGYPAIADPEVFLAIEKECANQKVNYKRGIMLTSDLFYTSVLPSSLELYQKAGVAGVEMEVSALFVIASLAGIRAGAVAAIDGNPLKWDEGDYDPHGTKVAEGKNKMLLVGLNSMAEMSKKGLA